MALPRVALREPNTLQFNTRTGSGGPRRRRRASADLRPSAGSRRSGGRSRRWQRARRRAACGCACSSAGAGTSSGPCRAATGGRAGSRGLRRSRAAAVAGAACSTRGAPPVRRSAAAAAPSSAAARGAGGAVHRHARCRSCRASPLYGRRYRCLLCPDRLELCEDCFEAGMHRQHPFASRERPGGAWSLAVRELPPTAPPPPPLGAPRGGLGVGVRGGGGSRTPTTLERALSELQHREIGPEVDP